QDRRGGRLDRDDAQPRPARLEHAGDAGDRAAGPDAGDERVEVAGRVAPDLLGGRLAVDRRVGRVGELLSDPGVRRQTVARPAGAIGRAAGVLELLTLLLGVLPAARRSHRDLVLANLLRRHQLAVAARPRRRPRLRTRDRLLWPVDRPLVGSIRSRPVL